MSISVKNISVSIAGIRSNRFNIELSGDKFSLANFVITERLLDHCRLSFNLIKAPDESIGDTQFQVCADIIGKEVTLSLETDNMENEIQGFSSGDQNADIEFKGFICNASASRASNAQYAISVEAVSWDGQLDDSPDVMHYNNESQTLGQIVENELMFAEKLESEVEPMFDEASEPLNYCVKWNETTWGFIRRLAIRHGEWLFSDGRKLYFGRLPEKEQVKLFYPSRDLTDYGASLSVNHLNYAQVILSDHQVYAKNNIWGNYREAKNDKMTDVLNNLNEAAFEASNENFQRLTIESLVGSGMKWEFNGTSEHLDMMQTPQAKGRKASLLNYQGSSSCSRLSVGCKLTIVDNYITDAQSNTKSDVPQDEILITSVVHTFSNDETYQNSFNGLAAATQYPPYANPAAVPRAFPCCGWVADNRDPERMGRVRVAFEPEILKKVNGHIDAGMTPWIRVVQPYTFVRGRGAYLIPEKNIQVLVDFEGGNAEMPYVRGCLYASSHENDGPVMTAGSEDTSAEYLHEAPDRDWTSSENVENNEVKALRTKSGHTIEIHDKGPKGMFNHEGYIRIYNAHKPHYEILLSSDRNLIKLRSEGNIELDAANDIIMKAGNDMKITVGHDTTAKTKRNVTTSSGNDTKIIADHDLGQLARNNISVRADNDIDIRAGKDRTINVEGNDEITIEGTQQTTINDSQKIKVANKMQTHAMDIRNEADSSIEMQSMTNTQKANASMSLNANADINIKGAFVKVN